MKVFGDVALTWPSFGGDGDADEHVIVATTNASWKFLCKATPDEYETVEISPKRADEPWVWQVPPLRHGFRSHDGLCTAELLLGTGALLDEPRLLLDPGALLDEP